MKVVVFTRNGPGVFEFPHGQQVPQTKEVVVPQPVGAPLKAFVRIRRYRLKMFMSNGRHWSADGFGGTVKYKPQDLVTDLETNRRRVKDGAEPVTLTPVYLEVKV